MIDYIGYRGYNEYLLSWLQKVSTPKNKSIYTNDVPLFLQFVIKIYICACELECKYRSVFGVIILPSLVLEGKLLDGLLFGCVILNFGDFLAES